MFRLMRIVGPSMSPTLNSGELVWVSPRAYRSRTPRRGELVAARPKASEGKALVKRIVGLPYDCIEMDGQRWQLGENEFFLLGDQRAASVDSRRFGSVTRDELIGPVWARVWPWKIVRKDSATEDERWEKS